MEHDHRPSRYEQAKVWSEALLLPLIGLGVGIPLSIAVVNWVYGIPEHVVWFLETTRLDVWAFWIVNLAGEVNETPWWW